MLFGGCDQREHRWNEGARPGDECECGGAVLVERRTAENLRADFEEFWEAWPAGHRVKKQAAAKRWRETRGSRPPLPELLERLELQKQSPRWQAGVIPDPDTWLHQRRWEDDAAALTWNGGNNGQRFVNGRWVGPPDYWEKNQKALWWDNFWNEEGPREARRREGLE